MKKPADFLQALYHTCIPWYSQVIVSNNKNSSVPIGFPSLYVENKSQENNAELIENITNLFDGAKVL